MRLAEAREFEWVGASETRPAFFLAFFLLDWDIEVGTLARVSAFPFGLSCWVWHLKWIAREEGLNPLSTAMAAPRNPGQVCLPFQIPSTDVQFLSIFSSLVVLCVCAVFTAVIMLFKLRVTSPAIAISPMPTTQLLFTHYQNYFFLKHLFYLLYSAFFSISNLKAPASLTSLCLESRCLLFLLLSLLPSCYNFVYTLLPYQMKKIALRCGDVP